MDEIPCTIRDYYTFKFQSINSDLITAIFFFEGSVPFIFIFEDPIMFVLHIHYPANYVCTPAYGVDKIVIAKILINYNIVRCL